MSGSNNPTLSIQHSMIELTVVAKAILIFGDERLYVLEYATLSIDSTYLQSQKRGRMSNQQKSSTKYACSPQNYAGILKSSL